MTTPETKRETKTREGLVQKLFPEAFQTERSAEAHPAKEAKRLGDCPPATAFLAVSAHAKKSKKALRKLADARKCRPSRIGLVFGDLFSISRNRLADLTLTAEQSYRGTLLGMHHGVDLFTLLAEAAREEEDDELAKWCDQWLAARRPLLATAVDALAWFAANADVALSDAKSPAKTKRRT